MPDWTVPLSDVRLSGSEIAAVTDVLSSGWLSAGPRVAAFEQAFAERQAGAGATPHAVAVSSGTAALHLICAGLGLGPGDEVILPSLTFAATVAAVHQTGATPVFAEIGAPDSPWLSAAAARATLSTRTAALVTVDYGGHPGELPALAELATEHGLALVEDAAHAVGASLNGAGLGTFGTAAAFSFFANKNLPLGEGGMVLTHDRQLAERLRRLRNHGLSATTWQRHQAAAGSYEVAEPGFNYRLDEPRAALGLALLERLASDNAARARLAGAYSAALTQRPELAARATPVLAPAPGLQSAWHIYPVLLAPGLERLEVRERLAAAGVQTSVHYPPLHRSPAFGAYAREQLPATDAYAARTLTLPLFPHMSAAQQQLVLDALAA